MQCAHQYDAHAQRYGCNHVLAATAAAAQPATAERVAEPSAAATAEPAAASQPTLIPRTKAAAAAAHVSCAASAVQRVTTKPASTECVAQSAPTSATFTATPTAHHVAKSDAA